jgi:hypothetical protein
MVTTSSYVEIRVVGIDEDDADEDCGQQATYRTERGQRRRRKE